MKLVIEVDLPANKPIGFAMLHAQEIIGGYINNGRPQDPPERIMECNEAKGKDWLVIGESVDNAAKIVKEALGDITTSDRLHEQKYKCRGRAVIMRADMDREMLSVKTHGFFRVVSSDE